MTMCKISIYSSQFCILLVFSKRKLYKLFNEKYHYLLILIKLMNEILLNKFYLYISKKFIKMNQRVQDYLSAFFILAIVLN